MIASPMHWIKRTSVTSSLLLALMGAVALSSVLPTQAHASTTTAKKKTVKKKTVKKSAKAKKIVTAAPLVPLLAATIEQLQAAQNVLVGDYACEFGKTMTIQPHPEANGYFTLALGKQQWVMAPHLTPTGATRLEDIQGNTLLLQILTKSMLMDNRAGRRIVDGCVHATQRTAEENLQAHPRASNF
jgi:hypothetical protein